MRKPFFHSLQTFYVTRTNMESIYFEKQDGSLCAQHCLNALLQGPYFTAVDLAMHAQSLDNEERLRMAESGVDSVEYKTFLQQPSNNMDDSGYFSVQVISSCLSVWGLDLVNYGSTERKAIEAQRRPELMKAYICNYRDHWFTVRRLARQWFNLNSLGDGPKLISDTYLGMFLAQLQQEGYSIFVISGDIPQCEADLILEKNPITQTNESNAAEQLEQLDNAACPEDELLDEAALPVPREPSPEMDPEESEELQRALELSLAADVNQDDEKFDEYTLNRAIEISLMPPSQSFDFCEGAACLPEEVEEAEEAELQRALSLSLECNEPEEVPRKRMALLENVNTQT